MSFMRAMGRTSLFCAGVVTAVTAYAHASPVSYTPSAQSVLLESPPFVVLRFSERVEPKASSITLFSKTGERLPLVPQKESTDDAYTLRAMVPKLGTGSYSTAWQVISADDGHITNGAYVFSVGQKTMTASASSLSVLHTFSFKEMFSTGLEFLGHAIVFGIIILFYLCKKYGLGDVSVASRKRFFSVLFAGAVLLIAGSTWYVFSQSGKLTSVDVNGVWAGLQTFLSTVAGRTAALRGLTGVGVFAVTCVWLFHRKKSVYPILLLLLVVIEAYLRVRVSHAAASQFYPYVSAFINAVHVMAKGSWAGVLVALMFVGLPHIDSKKDTRKTAAFFVRLSQWLLVSFAFAAVTGMYIVWLHVKNLENISQTHWGMYLLSLSLFAGLLLALRIFHQCTVDSAAVRYSQTGSPSDASTMSLSGLTLGLEMMVGVTVIFLSGLLVVTTPPQQNARTLRDIDTTNDVTVKLEEHPWEDDQVLLTYSMPHPETLTGITLSAVNNEKNIGSITTKLEKRFDGGFVFPKDTFIPQGIWTVLVSARQLNAYDVTSTFVIDSDTREPPHATADVTMAVLGMGMLLLCILYVLQWQNRRLRTILQISSQNVQAPYKTMTHPWIHLLVDALVIGAVIPLVFGHSHGIFQLSCEKNGHEWQENIPQKNGNILRNISVIGCTVGSGENVSHYADMREYLYGTRQKNK